MVIFCGIQRFSIHTPGNHRNPDFLQAELDRQTSKWRKQSAYESMLCVKTCFWQFFYSTKGVLLTNLETSLEGLLQINGSLPQCLQSKLMSSQMRKMNSVFKSSILWKGWVVSNTVFKPSETKRHLIRSFCPHSISLKLRHKCDIVLVSFPVVCWLCALTGNSLFGFELY